MSNNNEWEFNLPMNDDLDMYNSVYKDLIELIGIECTLKIYSQYNGQQLSFPKRLYSKAYVERKVVEEYNGSNIKQLAKKYSYTERWVSGKVKKK
jgi:Mor family transcriptional regulator